MANISIKMDDTLKEQAEILFNDLGMNLTTAFTIFVKQSLIAKCRLNSVRRFLDENGLETIDFKVLYLFIRKSCVLRRNRYTSLSRYINQKDSLTAKNPYIYIYGFFAIA